MLSLGEILKGMHMFIAYGRQKEGVEMRDILGGGEGEVEDKSGVKRVREGRKGKYLV